MYLIHLIYSDSYLCLHKYILPKPKGEWKKFYVFKIWPYIFGFIDSIWSFNLQISKNLKICICTKVRYLLKFTTYYQFKCSHRCLFISTLREAIAIYKAVMLEIINEFGYLDSYYNSGQFSTLTTSHHCSFPGYCEK